MFQLAKHGTLVGLLRFSPSFLFACAASNRANLAFKTTIIEDTHLTLAGIPFKVEANNSLIFLLLQTYEKKFAEFPFLFIFIIPLVNSLPTQELPFQLLNPHKFQWKSSIYTFIRKINPCWLDFCNKFLYFFQQMSLQIAAFCSHRNMHSLSSAALIVLFIDTN